jgi:hypothetical protein
LLDEALLKGTGRSITAEILGQLQNSAGRDMQELLPFLQSRGEEYAKDAERKLSERGAAEAKAMREILETQKKHIADTAAKLEGYDARQLKLDFGDREDEFRQLESNRRYWTKRLTTIEHELKSEPDRIRELYKVKARRIEPVGMVYLWPVTG